jgi:2-dehydro-3-deoxyphosphogluconate aldolase / (4S)-4-hydroxy-2-oxoglutarate aldolase
MLEGVFYAARMVPVAVFNDVAAALKTAELLTRYSLSLVEVTLRTPVAVDCIAEISRAFPGMLVGCGSVLSRDDLDRAVDAGARFGVAPCLDAEVVRHAAGRGIPFVPGVATPSELNTALQLGCSIIKVFPAVNLGGPGYISALCAPFKKRAVRIVPTGGISEGNLADFLKLPEVIACGATYIVDSKLIEQGDYAGLGKRIEKAKEIITGMK